MSEHNSLEKNTFGFWIYLMTDLLMFAALFGAFAALRNNVAAGPTGKELFDLNFVLIETLILLTSSFTCGLVILSMHKKNKTQTSAWLYTTILLGLSFLALEISEFIHLYQEGHSWQQSAFLSSYFTLVGTHGLHITAGLVWAIILAVKLLKTGLTEAVQRKLILFSLFWHFLDIVWIFIFTIVYLIGAV
jgi:cytochrome o ubiquinol oxidase subunit 3